MTTHQQQQHQHTQTTEQKSALDASVEATERKRASVRQKAGLMFGVPPDKVIPLLQSLWKTSKNEPDLTAQEVWVGLELISRYELDPFAKEIYVTRSKGKAIVLIGIDGWVKILDRTEHYDGFEQIHERDEKGNLEWIETRIYSKDRSYPSVYRAYMSEWKSQGGMKWKDIPQHMLNVLSFRHAARLFVPIGGNVITPEEAELAAIEPDSDDIPSASVNDQLADELAGGEAETDTVSEPEERDPVTVCDELILAASNSSTPEELDKLEECLADEQEFLGVDLYADAKSAFAAERKRIEDAAKQAEGGKKPRQQRTLA